MASVRNRHGGHLFGPAADAQSEPERQEDRSAGERQARGRVLGDAKGPETWRVEGETGKFSSNFTVSVKSAEEIAVRGIKRSERLDYTVVRDDESLRFEGRIGDRSSNFVLKPDGGVLTIEGTMNDKTTSVRLESDGTDIKVVGATPWGKVNYQIQGEGDQILVKGRVHKWFVNYRLDCGASA